MKGLINETRPIGYGETTAMRDQEVVSSGLTVEHHDNAYFERLRYFAELIGLTEAAPLGEAILYEEKSVDANPSEGSPSIV